MLDRPIVCVTVVKHTIPAKESGLLQMMMHTAAGSVRPVKPFEVLVIEEDKNEFIVGEDILGDLGISIDRQLEALAMQTSTDNGDRIEYN
eukprot:jgi/Phyca11/114391/e_gw1.26.505.1